MLPPHSTSETKCWDRVGPIWRTLCKKQGPELPSGAKDQGSLRRIVDRNHWNPCISVLNTRSPKSYRMLVSWHSLSWRLFSANCKTNSNSFNNSNNSSSNSKYSNGPTRGMHRARPPHNNSNSCCSNRPCYSSNNRRG
uniref:Uncharacterized protein n=1 Tax=Cacopsylla melanoneura TaxID=428564 RepID=A0A8D8YGM1_9HEMI